MNCAESLCVLYLILSVHCHPSSEKGSFLMFTCLLSSWTRKQLNTVTYKMTINFFRLFIPVVFVSETKLCKTTVNWNSTNREVKPNRSLIGLIHWDSMHTTLRGTHLYTANANSSEISIQITQNATLLPLCELSRHETELYAEFVCLQSQHDVAACF